MIMLNMLVSVKTFHPTNFKTVCVDIRFVLWIMDKYAGAGKLIDEMRLVK